MSDIIHLLPDSLANQIAAGEVVQRPASVVKELLENAIDAGSTSIKLIIKDAGRTLIQVIDNGKGMSENDSRMCFERHATSKITKTEDLFSIKTLGFRGEAMASIAAVAQVELKSKERNADLGTKIIIEGSETKEVETTTCPEGTSISVKNLFFNVPARRNFLKSNATETRFILDEFIRVALSHPEIEFFLIQNETETFHLKTGKLSNRIVKIFGDNYQEQLIAISEETDFVKIGGFIGKPEHAKKSRGEQFFFVNGRFIKNNYLNHAIMSAYEGLIDNDHFPFFVLFMELDPKHIDINVHPTKTEIKFDNEQAIYAILKAAGRKSLSEYNITPSLDFENTVHIPWGNNSESVTEKLNNNNFGKPFVNNQRESNNIKNWQSLYSFDDLTKRNSAMDDLENITIASAANQLDMQIPFDKSSIEGSEKPTFQLHQKYIVTQIKSGMMLIDQQAAQERIFYEKYLSMLTKNFAASQQFLFPQTIQFSPTDFELVMELEHEIKELGFSFNHFGGNTIVVNGVPADFGSGNEKELFEGLIEQYKQNLTEIKLDKRENLARSLAKKTAFKNPVKLTNSEMVSIIDQLFACENPYYTPDGRKTLFILDFNKITQLLA
jgi:DNA mismatch repair protein MutL